MDEVEYLNLEFSKAMVDVVKKMRKKMDEYLKKFELTHFHAMYVLELFKSGELTMSELTDNIGVDKANTSRVVKDLVGKDYVEKVGETDRKFAIKLTRAGKKMAQDFKNRIDKLMESALSLFSEREKDSLHKSLKKLISGINEACKD